jgi:hypothetical protein
MIHEFPDGTADAVIDGAMKAYAAQTAPKAQPKPRGFVDELKAGFGDALDTLKKDAAVAYAPDDGKGAGNPGGERAAAADRIGRDILGLVARPAGNVLSRYVNKPLANLTGLKEDEIQAVEMGATMAFGNRLGSGPKPAAAPVPRPANALATNVEKFEKAGVRPSLAAVTPGGGALAKAAAETPVVGSRARNAMAASIEDTAQAAGRTAEKYGKPAPRGATGEAVQKGVEAFNQRFSERAKRMYDAVFEPIEANEASAAAKAKADYNLRSVLDQDTYENAKAANALSVRNAEAQNAHSYEQALQDAEQAARLRRGRTAVMGVEPEPVVPPAPVERPLEPAKPRTAPPDPVVNPVQSVSALRDMAGRVNSQKLSAMITDPRLKSIADALEGDASNVRFRDLRDLRTWVRNAQGDDTLRQGIDRAQLQRLEQSLTADIYANAEALGGAKAVRRLRQADQFYALGSQRINGALQKFVGAREPKAGESTYDLVLRAASDKGGADTARLLALKKSLRPDEWGEVAATTIDRMGLPTAGAADQGPFSVNRFVTNYAGLSPEGKDLLFGKGALRQELDNLNEVATMQKGVERAANSSNTNVAAKAGAMGAGSLFVITHPATWAPVGTAAAGLAITGEAMTNPAFVRWVARLGKAKTPQQLNVLQRQLQAAAKANPALKPLALQVNKLGAGVTASQAPSQAAPASREPALATP